MATVDTLVRRVQVANLPPADSGRGVARLPVKLMQELGLSEGDVIEIVGKRSTAARAIRPYGDDAGLDIIRLDGLQRANAGVGSGDFVIAFSTAESVRRKPTENRQPRTIQDLPNDYMSGLFVGVADATEEAIYNSLFKATTVQSRSMKVEALPVDRTLEILRKYNAVQR